MNSPRTLSLLLVSLLIFCFGLAADLLPQFRATERRLHVSDNFFIMIFGDSSRLFANSAYTEADAYYHSGFYPTIFDNRSAFQTPHMAEDTGAVASRNQGGEDIGFMGPPRNWIDAFGRHFIPNRHTHLDTGGAAGDLSGTKEVEEILPWLKLSTELDPDNVNTYVVTAFWLVKLNQVNAAEQLLHDGMRQIPNNPQLLFELGRIYYENGHDFTRARNIWEAALRDWAREAPDIPQSERLQKSNADFDDRYIFEKLQSNLAQLETDAGNWDAAIARWKLDKLACPNPDDVQRHIDELERKAGAPASATNSPAR
jgi:tetratricopeptide (TPR) repeat protein